MSIKVHPVMSVETLASWLKDARQKTLELVQDLNDEQMYGPHLSIINPLIWEIGHVAWFYEKWVLRHVLKRKPLREDADALWDSIAIAHDTRWDLPLPSRQGTLDYMSAVLNSILEVLENEKPSEQLAYFIQYSVYHEDMHTEAFTYTRQTLGYPPPQFSDVSENEYRKSLNIQGHVSGDVEFTGGDFLLGADPEQPFVFDNEKWAHLVVLEPFAMSSIPVTESQFLNFVEDGGYKRSEFWSPEGWKWREAAAATHPVYWRKESNGTWMRRHFDQWLPLNADYPVIHVNYYEAEAYCKWAGRRLPTEAEWEFAASQSSAEARKRLYPWGNEPPSPERVNMDWQAMGCVSVHALPAGDSSSGLRQMLGNVWEWTSSRFLPYPGFVPDPYKEYSEPWFGTRRVLRGGAWATRSRMLRNTWRNYFTPDRRDVFAGFRTCALNQ